MLKRLILAAFLTFSLFGNVWAAYSDFGSRDWWVDRSGVTAGSIVDIQYQYLGTLGYEGTLNDRLRAWLIEMTGMENLTLNELIYQFFGLGICAGASCDDSAVPEGALTFNGNLITFNGAYLTFNP